MRMIKLFSPLLVVAAGMQSVWADGTIDSGQVELDMSGTIVAETCSIDTSSQNQSIHIGDFSAGIFKSVGDTSDKKEFDINFNNCTATISQATIAFTGNTDSVNPSLLALSDASGNSGMASGVGIELLDNNMKSIAINSTDNTYAMSQGDNQLKFWLRYKATTIPVTAGNASSVLYFDVSYQ